MRAVTGKHPSVATILIGVGASGTERRMAFVFEHLVSRRPGDHLLIVNRELYDILTSAGFQLHPPDVHILSRRSWIDRKRGAHSGFLANLGRVATLLAYRREIARVCRTMNIATVQVLLEMVPVLGLWPLPGITQIASLVSHLPKYYDRRSFSGRLLGISLRNYRHVDALYDRIAVGLAGIGVPAEKISHPDWNCVDHIRFHPEAKRKTVTFTGRAFAFKNPDLMLKVIGLIRDRAPGYRFHVLGQGPLMKRLARHSGQSGLDGCVEVGYRPDPSSVVNASQIHVCLEEYDNTTNQSLLEGMASGCAIVASDVGTTGRVVTPDVGILVPLDADPIAEAVLSLIQRPELRESMGRAARARILRHHSIDRYLDYLTGIFTRHERVQSPNRFS